MIMWRIEDGKGRYYGTVKSVPGEYIEGCFDAETGDVWQPDMYMVQDAVPRRWLQALMRRPNGFTYPEDLAVGQDGWVRPGALPSMMLRGVRGDFLATLYAVPYRFRCG